jgi:hypothetical protein
MTSPSEALTHHLQLVLDNDAPSYWSRRGITRQAIADAHAEAAAEPELHIDPLRRAGRLTGERLKDAIERTLEADLERLEALPRELLSTALNLIDWDGVGADYVAEELES